MWLTMVGFVEVVWWRSEGFWRCCGEIGRVVWITLHFTTTFPKPSLTQHTTYTKLYLPQSPSLQNPPHPITSPTQKTSLPQHTTSLVCWGKVGFVKVVCWGGNGFVEVMWWGRNVLWRWCGEIERIFFKVVCLGGEGFVQVVGLGREGFVDVTWWDMEGFVDVMWSGRDGFV